MKTLEYLTAGFNHSIRDSLWKDIPINDKFLKFLSLFEVRKLDRIRQLGPVALLYPSAVHTRLNHSLGVFYISNLILQQLLKKDENFITIEEANAFLAASLLHDLGHFPYAHSLKELALENHEKLGADLIERNEEIKKTILNLPASPEQVKAIIDPDRLAKNKTTILFRSLLSGALDPDKLDYLSRDAYFCGVPYGSQDVSYIVKKICLYNGRPGLPFSASGSVEHLLFAKYLMYRNVYWHQTTRNATAMIRKAIIMGLNDNIIKPEDLYGLDDNTFFDLPSIHNYKPFELLSRVRDNRLYYLSYEVPFNEENPLHKNCLSLKKRTEAEEKLFMTLKKKYINLERHNIIIDIPETVSFETHLPVYKNGKTEDFAATDELFTPPVIASFSHTLRKFRIFTSVPSLTLTEENIYG